MKLTLTLILFAALAATAGSGYSQNTRINLKMQDASLVDVFREIERTSEFGFFFKSEEIDLTRRVSIDMRNVSIEEILKKILMDNYDYRILDKNIVVTRGNFSTTEVQQQKSVSGKVTDSSGASLPGVSVVVKGTSNGTISDANGNYSLSNVPENATIQFSFIGMKSQEFVVGNKTAINVSLADEAIGIDEVIAVGYGTQKRNAVTGAVAQANLKPFENIAVNNILETVKGTVAGLNVGSTNTAGAVAGITIRGQNSQSAGSDPLIVVDGAIFSGSLSDISSSDIENLTVLKDASAAAIYGSRSANGVILIETKKGSGINGKPKFEIKTSYGLSNELEALQVYDAPGYIQRLLDIRQTDGLEADPSKVGIYLQVEEQKNYNATPDHQPTLKNPYELFRQMGNNLNAEISVSNRTEKSRYYISANLIKQKGVIIRDEYKKLSGRINIDSDLTDWFNLGIKSSYSLRDFSGSTIYGRVGDGSSTYNFSPYASLYNEDGSYRMNPQSTTSFYNPFLQMATDDIHIRNNLNAIVTGVIKVPWVKGLSYNVTYSNTLNWGETNYFYDQTTVRGKAKNSIGQRAYNRDYNMLLDNIIKYNNTFSEKHNFDVTLLYSREKKAWENLSGYAEGFDNSILGTYKLENGSIQTVDTGGGDTQGIGLMSRGTYTFDNKYSITGTIRKDGYSAFSKNKKWGTFPSVGVNWNISREGFLKNIQSINNLAIRASYGSNGNQSISAYGTLARMGVDKYLYYGDPSYTMTQYISSLPNEDLGWETTTGLNLGLDFSLINNRLKGSVDAYSTKTTNLLFSLPLPEASGKSSIVSNIGEIQNKGIEVNLSSINVVKGKFRWNSDFAFSLNRNKLVSLLGEDKNGDGKEDDLVSAGYFIGKSLGTVYNYKVIGMWQQADKDAGTIMTGMLPGTYKIEDVNDDGKITSDMDRQFLGNSKENFRWSMTNTFKYNDLSLMVYLYSIWGGNGYFLSGNNTPYYDVYAYTASINHPVFDFWTPTNSEAMFPGSNHSRAAYKGTKYFDRSFIKLQKVSLSYDLSKISKPWGLNGLTCSLSADNLFTYAPHWVGLDPETNSGLSDSAIPSIRTYLLSLSLNF